MIGGGVCFVLCILCRQLVCFAGERPRRPPFLASFPPYFHCLRMHQVLY